MRAEFFDDISSIFLRRICEHPFDSTLRSIYADWLEEQGHVAQADELRASGQLLIEFNLDELERFSDNTSNTSDLNLDGLFKLPANGKATRFCGTLTDFLIAVQFLFRIILSLR